MRAITSSCRPGTRDRRIMWWRVFGLFVINPVLWALIIWGVKSCL